MLWKEAGKWFLAIHYSSRELAQLTEAPSLVCFESMFIPPTIGQNSSSRDATGDPAMILQYPGLPGEVWTEGACGRIWIYTTASLGVLGAVFALATWHLNSLQREGMFGLVGVLAFFLWIGCNGLGAVTGLVSMFVAAKEDRKVAVIVTMFNVIPPSAVYFFLHK